MTDVIGNGTRLIKNKNSIHKINNYTIYTFTTYQSYFEAHVCHKISIAHVKSLITVEVHT